MSWFVATLVETALISVVVGGYLSVAFSIPLALSILGILAGEVVAINIGGFVLLNIIGRASETHRRLHRQKRPHESMRASRGAKRYSANALFRRYRLGRAVAAV